MLRRGQLAFTLVEVIIAIGILTLIFMAGFRAVSQISTSKVMIDDQREVLQIASSIFTRLTREMQMISRTYLSDPAFQNRYYVHSEPEQDFPAISFMASEAGQFVPGSGKNSGLVMLTYRLAKNPDSDEEFAHLLIRDEIPDLKPFEDALEERLTFPLSNRVSALSFDFYSFEDKKWLSSWLEERRMPAIIRINLEIISQREERFTFSTSVPVKASSANIDYYNQN